MSLYLNELTRDYPLPEDWSHPELFLEDITLGQKQLKTVGLSTYIDSTDLITGSAVDLNSSPWLRAYFELLERVSICEAISGHKPQFEVYDIFSNKLDKIERIQIFPNEPASHVWKYSKSNGVAAHLSFEKAAKSAIFELIERDRILRSWYTNLPCKQLACSLDASYQALTEYYTFEAYSFDELVPVIGVFGFPKSQQYPLTFGFGSSDTYTGAFSHAEREMIQRLAFLWGESLPSGSPKATPTADYHQDYYLCPNNLCHIRSWLNRALFSSSETDLFKPSILEDFTLVDITPTHLKSKLWVLKAISSKTIPLTFGELHPFFQSRIPHPIA